MEFLDWLPLFMLTVRQVWLPPMETRGPVRAVAHLLKRGALCQPFKPAPACDRLAAKMAKGGIHVPPNTNRSDMERQEIRICYACLCVCMCVRVRCLPRRDKSMMENTQPHL